MKSVCIANVRMHLCVCVWMFDLLIPHFSYLFPIFFCPIRLTFSHFVAHLSCFVVLISKLNSACSCLLSLSVLFCVCLHLQFLPFCSLPPFFTHFYWSFSAFFLFLFVCCSTLPVGHPVVFHFD